jgi:hypothetical protein
MMAKVSEDAAIAEFPLGEPKKLNRHVSIAINHLLQRRDKLNVNIFALTIERDAVDAAIKALDPE